MKRIKFITLFVSICFFLAACEKESTKPAYNDQPVIEGYLYAENGVQIKVSRQVTASENVVYSGDNIDSLNVTLSFEGNMYTLFPAGDGVYKNDDITVKEGGQYMLQFTYNGKMVSATTIVPSLPVNFTQSVTEITVQKIDSTSMPTPGSFVRPDPVELDWSNTDNSYYMVVVENVEDEKELIRDTTSSRFRVTSFRNEPSVINEYQLRDMQFQYFGKHIIRLYHLNPDYATLYNDNSNSSQNLTNPTTNITNGLGIFTGISVDTLYLQVNED